MTNGRINQSDDSQAEISNMVAVRLAEPYDLSGVAAFDSFPGERIAEIVERRMLVGEVGTVIVGYIAWQKDGCIGKDYVNKLVVDDTSRRKGVAKALLAALPMMLSGRVFISTGARNKAALSLLQRTGWLRAGEIEGLLPLDEAEIFFRREM